VNILTVSRDYSFSGFRPDSTLIRALDSYYIPDYVTGLEFVPVVCFRCGRPGKSIERRFARRYVDSFGYGILLYPELSEEVTAHREFISDAMDFTSIIPLSFRPMSDYGAILSENESGMPSHRLRAAINGKTVTESPVHPPYATIEQIISNITRYSSLRCGDFISCELTAHIAVGREDRITLFSGETLLTGVTIL